jgi:hypothetical protein
MPYQQYAQQGQQYMPAPPLLAQPAVAQPVQPGAAIVVHPKRRKKKQTQPQHPGQVPAQQPEQPMIPYNASLKVPQVELGVSVPPSAPPPVSVPPVSVLPHSTIGSTPNVPPALEQAKTKRTGKCWKCAVDTHATKDCTAQNYCLVCNNGAHPTA